ncbi:hypothetical protein B5E58_08195 [Tyzzerella sp. An114]|uniref:stalk domain-containing protein n=1 Tax=Tyzzerella sp. An114 TaxID=1965545 RepID=UPI000B4433EF|nr:stalk domain-containing protein [Tyzzerella sp. An114]OUQ57925.1 hypothetical protein B5E58_08195 [Tyzzerella sp. An114]HIT72300.1 DUF4352 domain-containing protein [Candidatus Fimicola cottocaccae]
MKIKSAVFGFIAGALCTATIGTAIGADTVVVGTLKPDIGFKIDGEVSYAPKSMSPINYNGYTYVPVRYIGEMLGCNVEWNAYGNMVIVDYPEDKIKEVVREVEKIVYVDKGDSVDGTVYSELPVTKRTSDFEVTLTGFIRSKDANKSTLYLTIENKQSENIQLDQDECVLTVDGEKYEITSRNSLLDAKWYNNIKKDDKVEGYLTFELVPEDYKEMSIDLVTVKAGEKTTTTINFTK